MSRYEYDQQPSAGGWDGPRLIIFAAALAVFFPVVALGGAELALWRYATRHRRRSRCWVLLIFLVSLLPAVLVAWIWDDRPLGLFLDAHGAVLAAAVRLLTHGSGGPVAPALGSYLVAIAPLTLPLAVLAAAAIGWLTKPPGSPLQVRQATGVEVPRRIEKRAAAGVAHPADGWALGYRADGQRVAIADAEARQHVLVCGATGAGKTTAIRHVLDGVAHRCPVVIVDCKASPTLRRAVEAIPGSLVWRIGGSLRWDALRGDPTCFASKLLAAESYSPGAAIYRAAAERYVQWIGQLLEATDAPRAPRRVAELLAPKVFATALRELRSDADEAWWRDVGDPLKRGLDEMGKAEDEGVSGFRSRFGVVVEGVAATSLGAGPGALVLEDAIAEGRTVLFSLDAAAYPTLAAKLGAWILLDLVRVAGVLQDEGWGADRQAYVVVDEFSALGAEGRHVVPLLARAREAGVAVVLATQGLADLERVDRALPQQVVQNTAVRILLRQGSAEDALAWARHGGEYEREELSRRTDGRGYDRDEGYARWRRDFHVRPDELHALGTGEAIVQVAPVVERKRRLERIRIAQPRERGAVATEDVRTILNLGIVRIERRV